MVAILRRSRRWDDPGGTAADAHGFDGIHDHDVVGENGMANIGGLHATAAGERGPIDVADEIIEDDRVGHGATLAGVAGIATEEAPALARIECDFIADDG